MKPGGISGDLINFADLLPTFDELAGAKLPSGVKFDGQSFAPQIRGEKGTPRETLFVQLGDHWYVRDDAWKLNQAGELFSMKDAPFVEALVESDSASPEAAAARKRLQAALDELNPAAGKSAKNELPKKAKAGKRAKKRAK